MVLFPKGAPPSPYECFANWSSRLHNHSFILNAHRFFSNFFSARTFSTIFLLSFFRCTSTAHLAKLLPFRTTLRKRFRQGLLFKSPSPDIGLMSSPTAGLFLYSHGFCRDFHCNPFSVLLVSFFFRVGGPPYFELPWSLLSLHVSFDTDFKCPSQRDIAFLRGFFEVPKGLFFVLGSFNPRQNSPPFFWKPLLFSL